MNERRVTYIPPTPEQIQQVVQQVCEHHAQPGDLSSLHPEIVSGLSDFLAFTAQLLVKAVNEGHIELLDKCNL